MNDSHGMESTGQMALPEIIQMCCQANRSGQIAYRAQEKSGLVFLQHGQIIHASVDGIEGVEAIFRMLSWPEGTFNFDQTLLPNKRTITQTWEQLLFEGATRADRATADPSSIPSLNLTTAAPVIMTRIQGSQPRLTVIEGNEAGGTFDITNEYNHLGRVGTNEIVLPYPEISSRHCMFILSGSDVILRDLNSSNGTYVNGEQITEVILQLGDTIQVGPVLLRFESAVKRPKLRLPNLHSKDADSSNQPITFHKKTTPLPKPGDAPADAPAFPKHHRPIVYTDLQKPELPPKKANPLVIILMVSMIIIIGGAGFILWKSRLLEQTFFFLK